MLGAGSKLRFGESLRRRVGDHAPPLTVLHFILFAFLLVKEVHPSEIHETISADVGVSRSPSEWMDELEVATSKSSRDQLLCGPYCLAYVARLNNCEVTVDDISQHVNVTDHGVSLQNLSEAAQKLGLDLEVVNCAPIDYDKLSMPAIAHLERNSWSGVDHFVVVLCAGEQHVTLFDWDSRRIGVIDRGKFAELSSGYFLTEFNEDGFAIGISLIGAGLAIVSLACFSGFLSCRRAVQQFAAR